MRKFLPKYICVLVFVWGMSMFFNGSLFAKKQKIIKYKKITYLDFSGHVVKGKIRSPEIFYIFQRKSTDGHNVLVPPPNLEHHHRPSLRILEETLQ